MERMNYMYKKKRARLGTLLGLLAITIVVFTNLYKPNVLNAENTPQHRSKWDLPNKLVVEIASNGVQNATYPILTVNEISMDWDSEESYLLAKIAMAEAEGESIEGKAMVIMVVLNRV